MKNKMRIKPETKKPSVFKPSVFAYWDDYEKDATELQVTTANQYFDLAKEYEHFAWFALVKAHQLANKGEKAKPVRKRWLRHQWN